MSKISKNVPPPPLRREQWAYVWLDQRLTPVQKAYWVQKGSMFFSKLPPEIRIQIYQYLLHAYEVINPYHQKFGFLPVIRRCVYETYPILYGENVFSFARRVDMTFFQFRDLECSAAFGLDVLGGSAGRLSFIRHVSLNMIVGDVIVAPAYSRKLTECLIDCWRQLEIQGHWDFPALEHLYIDVNHDPSEANNIDQQLLSFLIDYRPRVRIATRLANLRKITIKHAVCEPAFIRPLKEYLKPGVEVVVEYGVRDPKKPDWCWKLGF